MPAEGAGEKRQPYPASRRDSGCRSYWVVYPSLARDAESGYIENAGALKALKARSADFSASVSYWIIVGFRIRNALQRCEFLTGHVGLGERAAYRHADHVLGIVVGEEAAGAVARRVQALDGAALLIQHLHLRVDSQTVQRAQQARSWRQPK